MTRQQKVEEDPLYGFHHRYQQKLKDAREQHFASVSEVAWHFSGVMMLVVVIGQIGTSGSLPVHYSEDVKKMFITGVCSYGLVFANHLMKQRAVAVRTLIFYAGNIVCVVARLTACVAEPTYFLLQPLDVLFRTLVSAGILDIRYTVVGEACAFAATVQNYRRNVVAFHEDRLAEEHGSLWIMWSLNCSLIICAISYFMERWFKQITMLQLEAKDAQESSQRILSGLCDTVLHLDGGLRIKDPPANLLHMLSPGSNQPLHGRPFADFIDGEDDQTAFETFASAPTVGVDSALVPRPAASMHLHLIDTKGRSFRAQIFHTCAFHSSSNSLVHLLGVRYDGDKDDRPAEDAVESDIEDEAVAELPAPLSVPLPLKPYESLSQYGGSFVGGRSVNSMSVRTWRCPRCQASGRDWGDEESTAPSAAESWDSFNDIAAGPLHGTPPPPIPAAENVNEATLDEHIDNLQNWTPDVSAEVLESMQETHAQVCAVTVTLEETARQQHFSGHQHQLLTLLLVGTRLEASWSGMRSCWMHVVHMATGARPITLRSVGGPRTEGSFEVAWLLPRFNALEYPLPDIWDADPRQVYANFRKEVIAHTSRLVRRAAAKRHASGSGGP